MIQRIHPFPILNHFKVQMGTETFAAIPHQTDGISTGYVLPIRHLHRLQMSVLRIETVTVVDFDYVTVYIIPTYIGHSSAVRRHTRFA